MNQKDVSPVLLEAKRSKGNRFVKESKPFKITDVYVKELPNDEFDVFVMMKEEALDGEVWEIRYKSINHLFQSLG